jgi:hypothetical protein
MRAASIEAPTGTARSPRPAVIAKPIVRRGFRDPPSVSAAPGAVLTRNGRFPMILDLARAALPVGVYGSSGTDR